MKSKSIWFGLVVIVLAILEYIQDNTVSPQTMGIIGIVIVGLRILTTQPVNYNLNDERRK